MCKKIEENPSSKRSAVAEEFRILNATVTGIFKRKEKNLKQFQAGNFKKSAKRLRTLDLQDVDDKLIDWFRRGVADKVEGLTGH